MYLTIIIYLYSVHCRSMIHYNIVYSRTVHVPVAVVITHILYNSTVQYSSILVSPPPLLYTVEQIVSGRQPPRRCSRARRPPIRGSHLLYRQPFLSAMTTMSVHLHLVGARPRRLGRRSSWYRSPAASDRPRGAIGDGAPSRSADAIERARALVEPYRCTGPFAAAGSIASRIRRARAARLVERRTAKW